MVSGSKASPASAEQCCVDTLYVTEVISSIANEDDDPQDEQDYTPPDQAGTGVGTEGERSPRRKILVTSEVFGIVLEFVIFLPL